MLIKFSKIDQSVTYSQNFFVLRIVRLALTEIFFFLCHHHACVCVCVCVCQMCLQVKILMTLNAHNLLLLFSTCDTSHVRKAEMQFMSC